MLKRDVAILACKIAALFATVQAAVWFGSLGEQIIPLIPDHLSNGLEFLKVDGVILNLMIGLIAVGAAFSVAAILWRHADFLADRMTSGMKKDEPVRATMSAGEVETLAMALLGLLVLFSSIPGVTETIVTACSRVLGFPDVQVDWGYAAGATLQVAAAGWLMLRPHQAARILTWLRRVPPTPSPAEPVSSEGR